MKRTWVLIATAAALCGQPPPAATLEGLLGLPPAVSADEEILAQVLNPARTPPEGQWYVAGAPARQEGASLRVRLPATLQPDEPLRVTYFDARGVRVVDVLAAENLSVVSAASAFGPRLASCAPAGFLGQTICVCGVFPPGSWTALAIDGNPEGPPLAASRHVLWIRVPDNLAPGEHRIAADPAAGFPISDEVRFRALRLAGEVDRNALLRGQSTTMRLRVEGASEPLRLRVLNRTPAVISLEGGNEQVVETAGPRHAVERQVRGIGLGEFRIDYWLDGPPCPCAPSPEATPSAASREPPLHVPRRVLALVPLAAAPALLASAQAIAATHNLAVLEVHPLASIAAGLAVFEILDGLPPPAKAAALAADPRVILSQPDLVYDTAEQVSPYAGLEYAPALIRADRARKHSRGQGVTVAVIDTGMDRSHSALADSITEAHDVTGTVFGPDVHGTMLAGILAAAAHRKDSPMSGIAPGARTLAVKACIPRGRELSAARCWSSTLARGMDLALQRGARVLNLSVGGPEDRLLGRLTEASVRAGRLVVAAAGNDGSRGKPLFPAALDPAVAVTAVDARRALYFHATRGPFVDLAAPAVEVVTTAPAEGFQLASGTSIATAVVSAVAALLLEKRPRLAPEEIRSFLERSARDLGPAGRDPEFGAGLVDACAALSALTGKRLCD